MSDKFTAPRFSPLVLACLAAFSQAVNAEAVTTITPDNPPAGWVASTDDTGTVLTVDASALEASKANALVLDTGNENLKVEVAPGVTNSTLYLTLPELKHELLGKVTVEDYKRSLENGSLSAIHANADKLIKLNLGDNHLVIEPKGNSIFNAEAGGGVIVNASSVRIGPEHSTFAVPTALWDAPRSVVYAKEMVGGTEVETLDFGTPPFTNTVNNFTWAPNSAFQINGDLIVNDTVIRSSTHFDSYDVPYGKYPHLASQSTCAQQDKCSWQVLGTTTVTVDTGPDVFLDGPIIELDGNVHFKKGLDLHVVGRQASTTYLDERPWVSALAGVSTAGRVEIKDHLVADIYGDQTAYGVRTNWNENGYFDGSLIIENANLTVTAPHAIGADGSVRFKGDTLEVLAHSKAMGGALPAEVGAVGVTEHTVTGAKKVHIVANAEIGDAIGAENAAIALEELHLEARSAQGLARGVVATMPNSSGIAGERVRIDVDSAKHQGAGYYITGDVDVIDGGSVVVGRSDANHSTKVEMNVTGKGSTYGVFIEDAKIELYFDGGLDIDVNSTGADGDNKAVAYGLYVNKVFYLEMDTKQDVSFSAKGDEAYGVVLVNKGEDSFLTPHISAKDITVSAQGTSKAVGMVLGGSAPDEADKPFLEREFIERHEPKNYRRLASLNIGGRTWPTFFYVPWAFRDSPENLAKTLGISVKATSPGDGEVIGLEILDGSVVIGGDTNEVYATNNGQGVANALRLTQSGSGQLGYSRDTIRLVSMGSATAEKSATILLDETHTGEFAVGAAEFKTNVSFLGDQESVVYHETKKNEIISRTASTDAGALAQGWADRETIKSGVAIRGLGTGRLVVRGKETDIIGDVVLNKSTVTVADPRVNRLYGDVAVNEAGTFVFTSVGNAPDFLAQEGNTTVDGTSLATYTLTNANIKGTLTDESQYQRRTRRSAPTETGIKLNLDNSVWTATGESHVSLLNGANGTVVDLVTHDVKKLYLNETVGESTIKMGLDAVNRANSSVLSIGKNNALITIEVPNIETLDFTSTADNPLLVAVVNEGQDIVLKALPPTSPDNTLTYSFVKEEDNGLMNWFIKAERDSASAGNTELGDPTGTDTTPGTGPYPYADVKKEIDDAKKKVDDATTETDKDAAKKEVEDAKKKLPDSVVTGKDLHELEIRVDKNTDVIGGNTDATGGDGSGSTTGGAGSGDGSGSSSGGTGGTGSGDGSTSTSGGSGDGAGTDTSKPMTHADILKDHGKKIADNKKALDEHADTLKDHDDAIKANKKAIDDVADDLANQKREIDGQADVINTNRTAIDENRVAIDGNRQLIDGNAQRIDDNQRRLTEQDEDLRRLEEAIAGHETRITDNHSAIELLKDRQGELDKGIGKLNRRIDDEAQELRQGLAMNAAMTGLFKPYNVGRFNVTVAFGGYKSATAVAIGSGYRFNKRFAVSVGAATSLEKPSNLIANVSMDWAF